MNMIRSGHDWANVAFLQEFDSFELHLPDVKALIDLLVFTKAVVTVNARAGQNLERARKRVLMNLRGAIDPEVNIYEEAVTRV